MLIGSRTITAIILLLACSALSFGQNETVIKKGKTLYISNTVIIKVRNNSLQKSSSGGFNISSASALNQVLNKYSVTNIKQAFPSASALPGGPSLDGIALVKYASSKDPSEVAKELEASGTVEWAEPHYIYKTTAMPEGSPAFTPNDPNFSMQWWLTNIKAQQAWDITQGDSSVVIGIVDSGVEWAHPDLSQNIYINRKEIPGNGVDDDKNGYTDDVRGWDFGGLNGTPDANPAEDRPQHGTHVAGIAGAVTNNGVGVASIGNKCRLLAVKAARDDQRDEYGNAYIYYGYEGIVYAVDNGAKIINCSWGGPNYSRTAFSVVKYAVSKGVLIVTSAGNDASDVFQYPAAYEGVLSVGSLGQNDTRSYFTNYGAFVKVCAPGESIYATWQPGGYQFLSGTSMSTPLVSGLAGLVKTKFPSYTPAQVAEQIRVNCDNIDAQNPSAIYQLGSGRVNAYKALSNTQSKSVRAYDVLFTDEAPGGNGNNIFEPGETITVKAKFQNYLSPISGLKISLESQSPAYATAGKEVYTTGSVATLDSFNIGYQFKFTFTVTPTAPENSNVNMLIKFTDNAGYSDFQWINTLVNPSYADMQAGQLTMTIASKGNLGFNDYPDNIQGTGFRYKNGPNLLFEGSLMYGNSSAKIANGARSFDNQDSSFKSLQPFIMQVPGKLADYEGSGIFNDSRTPKDSYGIETKLSSYSYASAPNDKFIILKYSMTNKSGADITNLYAGLFFDWDINADSAQFDEAGYDKTDNFGWARSLLGRPATYAGCALISSNQYNYYAIDNEGADGGLGIYYQSGTPSMNGFTKAEKWTTLTNGLKKTSASNTDVSMVVSGGPISIAAGATADIAFAVAAGDNLADLKNTIIASRAKYAQILTDVDKDVDIMPREFAVQQNFPNPFNPSTAITYQLPEDGMVRLSVFNLLGEKISTLVNSRQSRGTHRVMFNAAENNMPSGMYIYRIEYSGKMISKKMMLVK